jgi:hypothetical protein
MARQSPKVKQVQDNVHDIRTTTFSLSYTSIFCHPFRQLEYVGKTGMLFSVNLLKNLRVLAVSGVAILSSTPQAQTTVITADKMVDVLNGKTVDFPAVFVGADGRITNIADARTVKWGSDVTHIDMSGKTILPGLIDMHVHLDSPADIGGYRGLEFTDSFWGMSAVGASHAQGWLYHRAQCWGGKPQ